MSLFQTIHMSPKGGRGNATIQKEVKLAMAIVRWEPFRDLLAMQDRMSREVLPILRTENRPS